MTAVAAVQRLDALQALRAVAAAFVVFVHALSTYASKVDSNSQVNLDLGLGGFGVKLFFCISGYIIYTSASNLAPGGASVSFFARRRLIRIVPLYWAATLIYAAKLTIQGQPPQAWELVCSFLFIPYTDANGLMRPVLGAGWTLNFEMLFYGIVCLSLVLDKAYRLASVAAFFALLLLLRATGFFSDSVAAHQLAGSMLADPHLLYFLAGMFVGRLSDATGPWVWLVSRWHMGLFFTLALLASYVIAGATGLHANASSTVREALELTLCTVVLVICVQPYPPSNPAQPTRLRRLMVAAGDGSYSTYLIHGFVMGPIARVLHIFSIQMPALLFASLMVLLCTMVGIFVFRFFEYPINRILNQHWGKSLTEIPKRQYI